MCWLSPQYKVLKMSPGSYTCAIIFAVADFIYRLVTIVPKIELHLYFTIIYFNYFLCRAKMHCKINMWKSP